MASSQRSPEELLKALELHHEQYLKTLKAFHESVGHITPSTPALASASRMERAGSSDGMSGSPVSKPTSPTSEPVPGPIHRGTFASDMSLQVFPLNKRVRRLTNELKDRRRLSGLTNEVFDGGSESEEDEEDLTPFLPPTQPQSPRILDEDIPCVDKPMASYCFESKALLNHLKCTEAFSEATTAVLDDVWRRRNELDVSNLFSIGSDSDTATEDDCYANATYEVYDVGQDGIAVAQHDELGNTDDEVLEASTVWDTIRDVNVHGLAVGRMTILQEPSPMMLAGVHMTLSRNFDMDEIFQHLVKTEGKNRKTKAYMNRAFEQTSTRQRSFFFVFKYYTVVGEGLTPAPWQQFDDRPPDRKSPDHIDITECSSVLALSLEGDPIKTIRLRSRRRRGAQLGAVYDSFAPWHLLHIQWYADDEHSMRSEDVKKPFYNGPYAFLDSLAAEYRDAVKRYLNLNELISKLTTPPPQFLFDGKLRDKLLFEDKDFTYSRRYFWAYNTLGVINEGIKSMTSAYHDTFTPDFWAGKSPYLWPHPDPESQAGRNYLAKMQGLRHEIERAVKQLGACLAKNEMVRQEIMSLREQLFSGSSVKESRRAIEQGDNIKILTGVSMLFLPLTFVTSVFGITEFTISASDWRFPVTMIGVCVPFFILIFLLQMRMGMEAVRKIGNFFEKHLSFGAVSDRAHRRRERQLQLQHLNVSDDMSIVATRTKRRIPFRRRRRRAKMPTHVDVVDDVLHNVPEKSLWRSWHRKKAGEDARTRKDGNV